MSARKQTVAQQIFKKVWHVRVPYIHTFGEGFLKHVGLPTSGDPIRDREVMNEFVDRYLSIPDMITIHSQGGGVIIVNLPDTAEIYKLLYEHLENWRNVMERSLHNIEPPIEDLRLMDEFAQKLLPIASKYLRKDLPVSGLLAKLGNMGRGVGKLSKLYAEDNSFVKQVSRPEFRRIVQASDGEDESAQQLPSERNNIHTPINDSISRMRLRRAKT